MSGRNSGFNTCRLRGTSRKSASLTPHAFGYDGVRWHTNVDLNLKPHESLTPKQRESAQIDYGTKSGKVTEPCREAVLFSTLRTLKFEANGTLRKGKSRLSSPILTRSSPFTPSPVKPNHGLDAPEPSQAVATQDLAKGLGTVAHLLSYLAGIFA